MLKLTSFALASIVVVCSSSDSQAAIRPSYLTQSQPASGFQAQIAQLQPVSFKAPVTQVLGTETRQPAIAAEPTGSGSSDSSNVTDDCSNRFNNRNQSQIRSDDGSFGRPTGNYSVETTITFGVNGSSTPVVKCSTPEPTLSPEVTEKLNQMNQNPHIQPAIKPKR
jgi:hypothetical protein